MSFWSKLDKNVLKPAGRAVAAYYTGGASEIAFRAREQQKAKKAQDEANRAAQARQDAADAAWLSEQSNATNFATQFGPNQDTAFERVNRTANPRGDQNALPVNAGVVVGGGALLALLVVLLK